MEDNNYTNHKTAKNSKLILGTIILVAGFLLPLIIPLVLASDLSTSGKSILSGLLAFGIPEVFMIVAVAVMGKKGYEFIKGKAINVFKKVCASRCG